MGFSTEDLNKFSHKIDNCLEHPDCRRIFEQYLKNLRRRDLLRALQLWERADDDLRTSAVYMEDDYQDMIERIDGFNEGPLLSINEYAQKLVYVKRECCRILNKINSQFVQYLQQHHRT